MREEWIQGRFEGVYTGGRLEGDAADPPDARRFSFEIQSGTVADFEWIPAPLETDAPGEQKQLRQERVKRVALPLIEEGMPSERPLFDVRIRDWKLLHPAEKGGRSFGTVVGTIEACLVPPAPALEPMRVAAPEPELTDATETRTQLGATSRRLASSPTTTRSEAVLGTDADVLYARLRWAFAILAWALGVAAFGWACGARAALLWGGPVAAAMLVRAVARRVEIGPQRLHHWLGVAVVLAAGVAWAEPVLAWWRAGCGVALLSQLPWVAAPVLISGLPRVRWPALLTGLAWAGVVCATCWQLDGRCTLPVGSEEVRPPPVREAQAPTVPTAPRTDPGGRWPATPSLSSVGASLSKLAERGGGGGGGGGGGAIRAEGGGSLRGAGDSSTLPSGDDALAPGVPAVGEPPARTGAGSLAVPESSPSDDASAVEPAPPSARRFTRSQSTKGGWVSADHRRAERDLVRISVEHATRSPDEFFGEARRRVYIPADRIFDSGTTRIRKKGELELARLANLLRLQPGRTGILEVHTDTSGSGADQEALASRQAAAIHDWLRIRGHLPPEQLQARGVGGSQPIVPPDGSHAAQKPNRRIEVQLLD